MTQTSESATTRASGFRQSPAVAGAIDTIIAEMRAGADQITEIRGPIDELIEPYEECLRRAADSRGRALLYPYLGSGLGNGALVELMDGSVKWDMICGIGVQFFGHSDEDLIRASLMAATEDTIKHGNLQSNFGAFEFAETLIAEAKKNSDLAHAFVSTSGAMANENALKICFQKHAPASRVVAFRGCFMGRTTTMSQIGDNAAARVGIPLNTHVDYLPFYDEVAAERVGTARYIGSAVERLTEYFDRYPNQHACFIFELVQGEGGFNTAPRDYFKALMELCRDRGVAVWDDEIQTFGRIDRMFAYEMLDLGEYIDVVCVGKMTQACATLFTERYNPKPGLLSGTFTGAGVEFAAGTRVIERLRDGNYYGQNGTNAKHYQLFCEHVRALAAKHPALFPKAEGVADIVGGVGGMMRLTPFGGEKGPIVRSCQTLYDEGVIMFYCGHGPFHLRMLSPLGVMKMEDWPRVFECVERGLLKAAE